MAKDIVEAKKKLLDITVLRSLTSREIDVFMLILDGKTNKGIATSLFITESAVKKHITSIFVKTETKSRNELFAKLIKEYLFQ